MDISSYFDLERSKSLNGGYLVDWCKGKGEEALVREMGRRDSYPLRVELLRMAVGQRSKSRVLLPYVLNRSSLPPGNPLPREALPFAVQIDQKNLRSAAFSFFDIWSLSEDTIHGYAQLFAQGLKHSRAFNLLASFDLLGDDLVKFSVTLPLVARNNTEILLAEARKNPKFADILLRDLDSTYDRESLANYPELDDELPSKRIRKTISTFLKFLDVEEAEHARKVPHFFHDKLVTSMRYHVNIKEDLRLQDWRDILAWNLDKYALLEHDTKRFMRNKFFNDEQETSHWNARRGWNLSCLTIGTQKVANGSRKAFFELELPASSISLVTARNFQVFLKAISEYTAHGSRHITTGYDSEFLNDFGSYQSRVVLIQIAIQKEVFILDMMDILEHPDLLEKLREVYFNNPLIKILGYGIHSDFQALATSHPLLADMTSSSKVKASVLDLDKVATYVSNVLGINYRAFKTTEKGLAGFIESLFGRPLDKSFQRSFWARRPLEEEQLIYGALDAYVLLQAYDALSDLSRDQDQHQNYNFYFGNVDRFYPESASLPNKRKSRSSKRKKKKQEGKRVEPEAHEKRGGSPPKFICNSMLHGLTKKLRAYGIGAHFLETSNPDLLADAALNSNRIILSRGKMVDRLTAQRSDVRVFRVTSDKADHQARDVVGEFEIVVSEEDIFKRCVLCNCDHYIILPQEKLSFLRGAVKSTIKGHIIVGSHQIAYPSIQLPSGVILRVGDVPEEVAKSVSSFYVCSSCGHVYWKGSHWERMKLKRNALPKPS